MTTMTATTDRVWSTEQNNVFYWFENGIANDVPADNLVVVALAGTGKTTTIIEGVNRAPEAKILLAAFNKRIADELVARISNPNATAKTLHAIGFNLVRSAWSGVGVASPVYSRENDLTDAVCGGNVPDAVKRLVSTLHTKAREIAPHATQIADLEELAVTFDCEPDATWAAQGFDTVFVIESALKAMELAAAKKPAKGIDFADMIYLPIRNGWMVPTYDLVVVDEAQDMTTAQLELAQGVCKKNGRICVVGDPNQAIYAFRGADSNSISRLKTELKAAELTLSTTYRCGQVIVEEAKKQVPTYQAAASNPMGEILEIAGHDSLMATIAHGDFLLSRLNAPLVSLAMAMLKSGKRARIAGKDIGKGLKSLINKMAKGRASNSIPAMLEKLDNWKEREIARFVAANRPDKADYVTDQAGMIATLCEGATGIREVESKIDALFTDDGLGQAGVITCSSVHKAKGLEAKRVLILKDTLRDGKKANQEEKNIRYVAVTRAITTLVWVRDIK